MIDSFLPYTRGILLWSLIVANQESKNLRGNPVYGVFMMCSAAAGL
jgi:hypothetical protein